MLSVTKVGLSCRQISTLLPFPIAMGTKSRNAKKNLNRGRGGSRGGRGRGRGGGRGGRSGVPTSSGYATQQPTSFKHMDDLYGDFKVYGQFGSESDDDTIVKNSRHGNKLSKPSKKKAQSSKTANPSQFAYTYKSDEEDKPTAAGLGYSSMTAASTSSKAASFGRSKYTKLMVFQKSTMLLNGESDINSEKALESTTSGASSPLIAHDRIEKSTDANADVEDNDSSDDQDDEEESEDKALDNTSIEPKLDDLLSNLTLQDPELQRVVQKLTRKERREQRYQDLMGIQDSDTDSDDDDLFHGNVDYEDDIILSGDDELEDEDEDEIAAMLDYIENTALENDGEDELRAYYQTLVQKLSSLDKKLEKEESTEESKKRTSKGKGKTLSEQDRESVDDQPEIIAKEESYDPVVILDESINPLVATHTEAIQSEVLLEPYSDEEEHIISTAASVSKRNALNGNFEHALSEDESDQEDYDGDFLDDEEEDEVDDFEDDEDELEGDTMYQEYEESDEDVEEEEKDDDYESPLIVDDDDEAEPVIIDTVAVPPSLQRGYNAISKYNAREARQRRMLKAEAFELESVFHLTDKQRRKLEKKQERERKKEKNMTTKKQKKMMKEMDENVDLRKIDQKLQQFIRDDSISSYQMAPMAKYTRRQLHLLATAYNLKSKSLGSGNSRYPVLSKTERTFIPNDRKYIERFIAEAQSTLDATSSILRKHRMSNNSDTVPTKSKRKGGAGKKEANRNGSPAGFLSGPSHGHVVAGNAAPISDQNIGHQMLAAMGWKQGDSLGTEGTGITVPIEAIVRKKRTGLGM
ncbi:hypothetical protein BGW37DRAFT_450035 [Umbelopsis sp. PMI_123]|nr:hypothetical protein BGW37DRAFT_450035 [Umbelopsis sp. PMI_123]